MDGDVMATVKTMPASGPEAGLGARLQLIELTKVYGDVVAADRVTLDIAPGEFITLLGPSGSGKTTTLMMVAGFVIPTSGQILVNGEDIAFRPPHKRNIGMVFQNYALFPHMTVAENIAFPLKMRKWPRDRIEQAVREALQLVRLPGFEQRYPRQLSGGQQQRVALARALVFRPPVLLMDEPLGALDKKLREEMQLEIKHIQESLNITTIYVTHDQEEALTMSDRIAVMRDGRIEQIGTPRELYEQPASEFVASFIGESNFLMGRLERRDGHAYLVTEDGWRVAIPDAEDLPAGEQVTVALRPERIVLGERRGENHAEATIEEIIYVGEATKFRVRLLGDRLLTVKQPSRLETMRWQRGERVLLSWRAEDAVLLRGRH
ncbi:ABC transporter ATP-binding protein [Thermomicrobium roseum DSM 5159]|uniref:Spermidine/putrescine import ATP-binding protein PotA n=2 Tax=Thermomicrobium roseum TaxID=500 RepID=B9KZG1_THERP|nr:ABC transporter ATP-binding protein [Thermomicrobium roseum DSM 5159]